MLRSIFSALPVALSFVTICNATLNTLLHRSGLQLPVGPGPFLFWYVSHRQIAIWFLFAMLSLIWLEIVDTKTIYPQIAALQISGHVGAWIAIAVCLAALYTMIAYGL